MAFVLNDDGYYDKVLGGWVGKCAGGILGAPIEGYKTFNIIPLSDDLFANNFANDDLDLQVLWLDMVDHKGPYVRQSDFAEHWLQHVAFPWNEYGIASRNLRLGLDPPDSGRHNNQYWRESMGSPIRSEIWGMLFPGDPARAAFYARMDSELDHVGFSVHAEQYLSACAALAFTHDRPRAVLPPALEYIPSDSTCARMVRNVLDWYDAHGFSVCAAKIKSLYGDADFTAAPMNVAFAVLAIAHADADFDRIIRALHLGHDSDCIVATAGAILGIAVGHDRIPQQWKDRVGNELLISPEVSGIRCPDTLTELAEWTCATGRKLAAGWPAPERPFTLHTEIKAWPGTTVASPLELEVTAENLTDETIELDLMIDSPYFIAQAGKLTLAPLMRDTLPLTLAPTATIPEAPTKTYRVLAQTGGREYEFKRGVPTYGSWLLVGPFIEADDSLAPMDREFPDHGMSSLPSVRYMNHDRVNTGTGEFVGHGELQALLNGENRSGRPYGVTEVRPRSMTIDAGEHFHGRGERSFYLTTVLTVEKKRRLWLCLGSANPVTVWLNGEVILSEKDLKRRWPAARVAPMQPGSGSHVLTIRVDTVVDDYRIDVGLKDHAGRHHHQSHWNTDLLWRVPSMAASRSAMATEKVQ